MRYSVLVLSLFVATISITQQFERSKRYKTSGASMEEVIKYGQDTDYNTPLQADVVMMDDPEFVIYTYTIDRTETYETTIIDEWMNPGLKGVESVLRIQVEFSACCADIEAFYFLKTKKNKLIELPSINYGICDFPADIDEYDFSANGEFFRLVTNHYDHIGAPTKSRVKKIYKWNGRNYREIKGRNPQDQLKVSLPK